ELRRQFPDQRPRRPFPRMNDLDIYTGRPFTVLHYRPHHVHAGCYPLHMAIADFARRTVDRHFRDPPGGILHEPTDERSPGGHFHPAIIEGANPAVVRQDRRPARDRACGGEDTGKWSVYANTID